MVGLPHRFADRSAVADVLAAHEELEPGASSGTRYRLAGRVLGRRGMGKAAFLDLEDRSGRIQLMASSNGLGEQYEQLTDVNLGDIVGVSGEAVRSRRGELSLQLDSYELLARNERPLPDKHHGLADVETRYRQRYLDLLINPEVRAEFELRARAITALRRELDGAGFIEVETPTLQPLYGGANARPFTTHHNELDRDLYLRIATELYLKRLIVGGLERVYEIGKNFRNEGVSFKHNPEFTLLEWYEAYADVDDAMTRTESLVAAAAIAANGTTRVERDGVEVDLAPPWPRIPLMQAIRGAHRHRRARRARPRRAAPPRGRRRRCGRRRRQDLAPAGRPPALPLRRARDHEPGLPRRLPGRALAARAPPGGRPVDGRALRGLRRSAWRSRTASPS